MVRELLGRGTLAVTVKIHLTLAAAVAGVHPKLEPMAQELVVVRVAMEQRAQFQARPLPMLEVAVDRSA